MDRGQEPRRLKAYQKPTVTKLTREQATLKLRAHAERGDHEAKELLALMSSPPKEVQAEASERPQLKKAVGSLPDRHRDPRAT
jgi:hypothetical protein